jgi:hypothetical protein
MIKNFVVAFVVTFSLSLLAYTLVCAAIYDSTN